MTVSRRHFMYGALLAGAIPRGGFGSVPSLQLLGYRSPNEKLNVAGIGVGGRGGSDLASVSSENVVALADVDQNALGAAKQRYPGAAAFNDFRQMLDKQAKAIDAVTIGTPDHMHGIAALSCMQLGKHVYVEKPLVRTPWEARILTQAAVKYKVATQMGNQGYSHEATRMASEIIWSGEIGDVREVHAYRGRAGWPQGAAMQKIPPPEPVPPTLNWDAWLGPAEFRPYTSGGGDGRGFYLPFNWRGHFDFGTGGLIGDWGIHILGPANMALRLGAPISVECVKQEGTSPFAIPDKMHIRWEFPARGSMPPVTVHWYVDYPSPGASDAYVPPGMTVEQMRAIPGTGPEVINISGGGGGGGRGAGGRGAGAAGGRGGGRGAAGAAAAQAQEALAEAGATAGGRGRGGGGGGMGSGYNQIFVGSKGYLGTNGRGEGVGLIPGERWAKYSGTPRIQTRSPGHARDWLRACKGGDPACSDFAVSGPYTEWVALGAIALRAPGKLMWDAANMRFTGPGATEANKYVKPFERKGWEMKL